MPVVSYRVALADPAILQHVWNMTAFSNRRRVPFTPRQMYDLVADVEQYPAFVPLCETLRILSRDRKQVPETLLATMTFGYAGIREEIKSRVTLLPDVPEVRVAYIDGPFKYLDNVWTFHPAPGGCDVDFRIAYELKSYMLQMLVGAIFEQTFQKFSEAFEARARKVYGAKAVTAAG
jgi:coenzyme Q-binding protein COQ10